MNIYRIRDGVLINLELIEAIVEDGGTDNRWYINMRSGAGFSASTEEARKLIESLMLLNLAK